MAVLLANLLLTAISLVRVGAATYSGYTSLDPTQPITFNGDTVTWNGKTFTLGPKMLFLDYRLDAAQIAGNPYAFKTIQAAAAALVHGTATEPMVLLTAPGVYWVDDPDDPTVRTPVNGAGPTA